MLYKPILFLSAFQITILWNKCRTKLSKSSCTCGTDIPTLAVRRHRCSVRIFGALKKGELLFWIPCLGSSSAFLSTVSLLFFHYWMELNLIWRLFDSTKVFLQLMSHLVCWVPVIPTHFFKHTARSSKITLSMSGVTPSLYDKGGAAWLLKRAFKTKHCIFAACLLKFGYYLEQAISIPYWYKDVLVLRLMWKTCTWDWW